MRSQDTVVDRLSEAIRALVEEGNAHNRMLGLRVEQLGPAQATCLLPCSVALAASGQTNALHATAIVGLIDVACGAAVIMALGRCQRIATLELRVDHLRPPDPDRPVRARGECLQVVQSVAFVRALADDGAGPGPVAAAQGTFVLLED